jgi:hypothetical protein
VELEMKIDNLQSKVNQKQVLNRQKMVLTKNMLKVKNHKIQTHTYSRKRNFLINIKSNLKYKMV